MSDGLAAIVNGKGANDTPTKRKKQATTAVVLGGRSYKPSKNDILLEQIAGFFEQVPANYYACYLVADAEGTAVIYAIPFHRGNRHLEILRHFNTALGIFARNHNTPTGVHYIDSLVGGVAGGLYTHDIEELRTFLKSLNIKVNQHQMQDDAADSRTMAIDDIKTCLKSRKSAAISPAEYMPAFEDFLRYELGKNDAAKDKPLIYELVLPNPTPALIRYFKMVLHQK